MNIGLAIKRHRSNLLLAGVASGVLGLTMAATLGGFSAIIDNNSSSFNSGVQTTVSLRESNGTTTCNSSSGSDNHNTTCGINALNGALDQMPGGTPLTSTITLSSVGSQNPTDALLSMGACDVSDASDAGGDSGGDTSGFCGEVDVTIANTTPGATDQCVFPMQSAPCPSLSSANTLAGLANTDFEPTPLSVPVSGTPATYVISVELDPSATDADQGLSANLPFSWSIS